MSSPSSEYPISHRLKGARGIIIAVAALVAVGVAWWLLHRETATDASAPPPAPVTVATPLAREVTEWDDYIGRFRASQAVDVRPRVPGQVTGIYFTDGQIVQKGQLLFTLDQRRFLAGQSAARADLASARSDLMLAKDTLARAKRLSGENALSRDAMDELRAKERSAQAAIDRAGAQLRDRSLDVEFTEVRAPIGGRISDRRVDIGNQVAGSEANSGTLLTTIQAMNPIYFEIDASEALYLKTQRETYATGSAPRVEIRLQDEPNYQWKGSLDFTDNALNPHAGTIRGRATIANPKGILRPGLFGNMRLSDGGKVHALLVPDAAVQTDQARKIVLVVNTSNVVSAKEVVPGPLIDGLRIIQSGLSESDRVVIDGIGAAPSAKVSPKSGRIEPSSQAQPTYVQAPESSQATFSP